MEVSRYRGKDELCSLCCLVKGKSLHLSRLQCFRLHVSKFPSNFWSEFHVNRITFTWGKICLQCLFPVLWVHSALCPCDTFIPPTPITRPSLPGSSRCSLWGSFPRSVFPPPEFSLPRQYVWVLRSIPSGPSSLLKTWLTWLHQWVTESSYVIPKKDICILTRYVLEMMTC